MDEGRTRPPQAGRNDTLVGLGVFGLLFIVVVVLLATREIPQELSIELKGQFLIDGWDIHFNSALMGVLAAAVAVGVPTYLRLRGRTTWARKVAPLCLVLVVFASGFAYLYGTRGIAARHYPRMWDSFHYILGPKYFDELGYWELYDCVALADREGANSIRGSDPIRDLHDYSMKTAAEARLNTTCKEAFSDERWEDFRHDVGVFRQGTGPVFMREVVQDHGYNGTPFHTFLARALTNAFALDFESLVWTTLIDVGAICLMGFVAVRAFGWRVGLLFGAFFFLNFSDRFFYNGASFARYLWVGALGIGLAMLHMRRHAVAAFFLVTSAMLVAFPALFLIGVTYKAGVELWRKRSLSDEHRRFLSGAVAGVLVIGGLSISYGEHLGNYEDFLGNMSMHSSFLSKNRIGFIYDFLFRGEITLDDPAYGWASKRAELDMLRPLTWTITALVFAAVAALTPRLDDLEATILVGFALLFMLFGTVEYYYAFAAILVLLPRNRLHTPGGRLLTWLPFALMVVPYAVYSQTHFLPFCNNILLSLSFTVLLFGAIGWLGKETGLWADVRERWARWRGKGG